ncbi:hypothetical protein COCOBI_pt-0690 (chloroplast) [Coccomyxa sp. Obi]|nr:hypothetical protein COCOBI_pt-0690 [Coccomyxa sp. Obi]
MCAYNKFTYYIVQCTMVISALPSLMCHALLTEAFQASEGFGCGGGSLPQALNGFDISLNGFGCGGGNLPQALNGLWAPVPIPTNPLLGLASQVFGILLNEWPVNLNGDLFKMGGATW